MEALKLDFCRRWNVGYSGAWLLLVGILTVAGVGGVHWRLSGEADAVERKISKLRRTVGGQEGATARTILSAVEKQEMEEVARRLSLPSDKLFDAVEKVDGKDVALLSLQPEDKPARVRISGEARDAFAMLQYVDDLQKEGRFARVRLLDHEINERDAEKPVRFTLVAEWRK